MPQSETLEIAAEVVAAFVSNNPLPKGELPALIQTIHDFFGAALRRGGERRPEGGAETAGSVYSQIDHAGIFDLLRRWQKVQVAETARGDAWPDAGAVSREMESSVRLSYGRAQLCRGAVGIGQSDRSWTIGRKGRSAEAWTPAESRSSLIRIAAPCNAWRGPTILISAKGSRLGACPRNGGFWWRRLRESDSACL